ncbi:MAG: cupin domain-containing protein [Myxococcales bacterium]|nr:cupin domain-containing protein [Myxococcales bacterium]
MRDRARAFLCYDDEVGPDAGALIEAVEVVLPCERLDETAAFFVDALGFRVVAVRPADDPIVVVVEGHGARLRLTRGLGGDPGALRLLCRDPAAFGELVAPNGTRIELVDADPPVVLPPLQPAFVVSRKAQARWVTGRAGMRYRDLIPGRQGGRFVASHIEIPDGGPVPDYVHYHRVRFQLIYCCRGWVRLVYEDQGPPFLLRAGDCVLQPPRIRHRVLESSPGLEVIEVGCPADHETLVDHALELPTASTRPERRFDGQRFVRHQASRALWGTWRLAGFACRDLGIAAATGGIASACVVRPRGNVSDLACRHDAELLLLVVLDGAITLQHEAGDDRRLEAGDAVVIPAGLQHALTRPDGHLELLEVAVPGGFSTRW